MANCRWVDVFSSESCTSFGRSAFHAIERSNHLNIRATAEQLVASLDQESLECLKQGISESQVNLTDSFMDFNRPLAMMDGRTGITMELQQKMHLCDDASEEYNATQVDIVSSLYDDLCNAPVELLNVAPVYHATVKEPNGKMVSFSGFLDQPALSQNSLTPVRSEAWVGTEPSSPKSKQACGSSSSTPVAFQSPDKTFLGPVGDKGVKKGKGVYKQKDGKKDAQNKGNTTPKKKVVDSNGYTLKGVGRSVESAKRQKGETGPSAEVYFDDQTRLPLNPPKKAHVVKGKFDQVQISKILLNQFSQAEPKQKQQESQAGRLCSRLKDIAIGKSTKGYQNYIKKVPIDQRTADDPQTPNMRENISAARFQTIYRKWRTSLHKYDNI
ncbi:hypothetical protein BgAZ_208750 [Babesia gibsoni]|uniref:Histone RNA hairpin-binding protein RNA-binding domain-containing protein n=1 Tax=Babesia gibsoni TaxID=33632 RepID=A0AAD8UUX4_BABGI|nr:hypothetical protein BgAZ_208750 [Babesia gibsoni]